MINLFSKFVTIETMSGILLITDNNNVPVSLIDIDTDAYITKLLIDEACTNYILHEYGLDTIDELLEYCEPLMLTESAKLYWI